MLRQRHTLGAQACASVGNALKPFKRAYARQRLGVPPAPEVAVAGVEEEARRVAAVQAPHRAVLLVPPPGDFPLAPRAAVVTTVQAILRAENENRNGYEGELQSGRASGLMEAIVDRAFGGPRGAPAAEPAPAGAAAGGPAAGGAPEQSSPAPG